QFFLTGAGAGQTQFGTTNNTILGFTVANAGLTALTLDTGAGHDSLTGNALDPSFSPELTVTAADTFALHGSIETSGLTATAPNVITVDGSVQTRGGELSLGAETITVAGSPGARIVLDTRELDAEGAAAGDSGDITLEGRDISISHVELRADVDNGSGPGGGEISEAGAIEVTTDDSAIRQSTYFSPVFAGSKDASVDIEDSSIHGGDVSISATAEDQNLYDDLGVYVDKLVGNGFGLLGQVPGILTSLISGIAAQVDVRLSSATINLAGSDIESSEAVDIAAHSVANASFHTVAVSSPLQQFVTLAIGYGEAQSTATATLTGSSISAEGSVSIDTSAVSEAEVKARSSVAALDVIPGQANQSAFSVAIGNTSETSQILVDQNSAVVSRHGAVGINADGEVVNFDWAEPSIFGDGTAGVGIALSIDKATISARVDGTIDAVNSVVGFGESGVGTVDTAGNTITLPDLQFRENEAVVYNAPAHGAPISGLTDGGTYFVHVLDPTTGLIQLTLGLGIDLDNAQVDPTSTQTLSRVATKPFDAAAVDTATSSILLSGLADGTKVTYIGNSNDPDTDASRGIGGLLQGHDYLVHNNGDGTISLTDPTAADPSAIVALTSQGSGTQLFVYSDDIQSFNPSTAVDSDADTIHLANHGLETGDAIVYAVDPTKTSTPQPTVAWSTDPVTGEVTSHPVNATLSDLDRPVTGLSNGQLYYVVKLDDNTIRLATSREAAFAAAPVDLTSTGGGSLQSKEAGVHAKFEATNESTASAS
ncbi:MAG TPA: hypothetical protein VIW26_13845, partial [Gemmatimonadales bacterium]